VTTVAVPYHLDEHLPDFDPPVPADVVITADLPPGDPWQRMARLYEPVAAAVAEAVAAPVPPLVLSGDCTTSFGVVAGLQRVGLDPSIVWFDGHGDVQTLETTASGYLGGMPLRMLVGYRPELVAESLGLRAVAEDRVVLVDARDLDPPEAAYLATAAIRRAAVPELAAADVPDGPLYLHLDIDVADPADVAGLRFPAPDGPGVDAVFAAATRVVETGRVAAFGLACTWFPGSGAAEALRPRVETLLADLRRTR
jgi:arginase